MRWLIGWLAFSGLILVGVAKPAKSSSPPTLEDLEREVDAQGVLLVDATTGTVLFERNADQGFHPASITKLMTALLVYEKTKLMGSVVVSREDLDVIPSRVPLREGEQVSVRDLLFSLMLGSDNDSAMALARTTAGSLDNFLELMNRRARELGCRGTHFVNPSGLPAKEQVTTARDMLKIFQAFLSVPELVKIAGTRQYVLKTQVGTQIVRSHNRLLGVYPGMDAGKTGWTRASRHTYAARVIRDGREVHLILLYSRDKWRDAPLLFDYAFANLPALPTVALIGTSRQPEVEQQNSSAPVGEKGASSGKKSVSIKQPSVDSLKLHPSTSSLDFVTRISPTDGESLYIVQSGDTLTSISRQMGCSVEELVALNRLEHPDRIQVGQRLRLPRDLR